ncbi:MAG: ATP-binding cassette domain-containing protein [Hyphomicrobiales bacterium]|nr:ATP-binding cassette domain-containing protein [Hyphomicrobiales bacterium]MBV8428040.1 ATP-binding cassette domain-containing protein [Hyphomicrobiales bacterium]
MRRAGETANIEVSIRKKAVRSAAGERKEILADIAFALAPGEVTALVGPSGSGKTTLLKIVAGLDRDFEGAVSVPTRRLGFVFQEPRLLPWRSVEENVRIAAPEASDAELDAIFEALGLAHHRRHYPGELSLGLARRAAVARAFAVRPDLLLLDEPFVSLDETLARQLQEELIALVERSCVTSLLVTHDILEAARLVERVIVLDGRPARMVADLPIEVPRARRSANFVSSIAERIRATRLTTL